MRHNQIWTLFLKALAKVAGYFNVISLMFQVKCLGQDCRVLSGLIINGGRNILIGNNVYIGRNVVMDAAQGRLEIGDGVEIRDGSRIYARSIQIGDRATIGEGAFLNGEIKIAADAWIARGSDLTGNVFVEKAILGPYTACIGGSGHVRNKKTNAIELEGSANCENSMVTIQEGAWTGHRSIILRGVVVGKNAVVGAGSVITKSVASNIVVAGNPAKPINSRLSTD